MGLFFAALATIGSLGAFTQNKIFVFPALAVFLAYAIWSLIFSCPKCGTPYLYIMKGIAIIPTGFPSSCKKCGLGTDINDDPKNIGL